MSETELWQKNLDFQIALRAANGRIASLEADLEHRNREFKSLSDVNDAIEAANKQLEAEIKWLQSGKTELERENEKLATLTEAALEKMKKLAAITAQRDALQARCAELEEKGDAMARCLEWYCEGTSKGADRGSIDAWNKAKGAK